MDSFLFELAEEVVGLGSSVPTRMIEVIVATVYLKRMIVLQKVEQK